MSTFEHHEQEEGIILKKDSRKGRRVLYTTSLPEETLYGTIEAVTRFSFGDGFLVRIQLGRHINADAENFLILEKNTPEWHPEDEVRFYRDKGDFWDGVVLHPLYFNESLRILVHFQNGQEIALQPTALRSRT